MAAGGAVALIAPGPVATSPHAFKARILTGTGTVLCRDVSLSRTWMARVGRISGPHPSGTLELSELFALAAPAFIPSLYLMVDDPRDALSDRIHRSKDREERK